MPATKRSDAFYNLFQQVEDIQIHMESGGNLPKFFPLFTVFLFCHINAVTVFQFIKQSPFCTSATNYPFLTTVLLPTVIPSKFHFRSDCPFPSAKVKIIYLPAKDIVECQCSRKFFAPFLPGRDIQCVVRIILSVKLIITKEITLY